MERDERGRFVAGNNAAKGNKGGPGRPKKPREERYYQILMTACSFSDWKRIVQKAVDQAKKGNPAARKWLSDYLIGVPPQRHELTGIDGEPLILRVKGFDEV